MVYKIIFLLQIPQRYQKVVENKKKDEKFQSLMLYKQKQ